MSNYTNDDLFERVADMMDYFEGKQPAKQLQRALDSEDWDALYWTEKQARAEYNHKLGIREPIDFTIYDEDEAMAREFIG